MSHQVVVGERASELVTEYREKPTLICNTGNSAVYLSDAASVTEGNGVPLNPGFCITWDKDIPCWGVSPTGNVTLIMQGMTNGFATFS